MDAVGVRQVPGESMLSRRMWRWCIARTLRDLRESVRRGQPINRRDLRRLFQRRWSELSIEAGMAEESEVRGRREVGGCYVVESLYALELREAARRMGWSMTGSVLPPGRG